MFTGPVESGLAKMAMIGLGKLEGATLYHRAMLEHGWTDVIDDVVPVVHRQGEDPRRGRARRAGRRADGSHRSDASARTSAPTSPGCSPTRADGWRRLPFTDIDLLLLDEIGKNISGAGFDPTVVGRKDALHHVDPSRDLRVRFIAARNLTEETHGNAVGVGHRRVLPIAHRSRAWTSPSPG